MLINGDSVSLPFQDNQFHCVVTSPPYWGLRKYSGEQSRIWGGDPDCEHEWEIEQRSISGGGYSTKSTLAGFTNPNTKGREMDRESSVVSSAFCRLCSAWYGALGLEPTPDLYIQHIVEIFREVCRVLRDDGVAWLNLGDSYSGSGKGAANYKGPISGKQKTNVGSMAGGEGLPVFKGFPAGNLMMVPHRVAIALQEWGWIVRQGAVWWKRNPMPESQTGHQWEKHQIKLSSADVDWKAEAKKRGGVLDEEAPHHISGGNTGFGDKKPKYVDCPGCGKCEGNDGLVLKRGSWRHTGGHEYIFMLSKKMQYWANSEVVKEKDTGQRGSAADIVRSNEGVLVPNQQAKQHRQDRKSVLYTGGRNPRSVLDVPTAPYRGAHYATFPPNLIAPLIRATCPRWACPVCGQGWSPVVEKMGKIRIREGSDTSGSAAIEEGLAGLGEALGQASIFRTGEKNIINVKEYRPTCEHPHTIEETVPGIVLDPFVGSGTTVMVANDLLRRGVGIDISMEYLDGQAKVRTKSGSPTKQLDNLPMFE